MTFVDSKQIHAKKIDRGPAKLLTGARKPEQKSSAEPSGETEAEETLIGPPRPAGKKAKQGVTKGASGLPSYLEKDLSEFPLFMDKLPAERSSNPDIAALQDLAAEETKEQRAENFKQSGNECLTRSGLKYWDSAIEYYTRAIQCGSENLRNVSIYFSNRAAVQMLKKNWGHAIKDCLMALELDESNVKAMYRAAKSYYEVRKLPEALKYLKLAMSKSGKTKQLLELEKDIARRMRKERLKEEKKHKETEEALEKEMDVHKLFRERGYKFTGDDVYELQPRLTEMGLKIAVDDAREIRRDAKEGEKEISFPVMVIYPQCRQSDFIARWPESFFLRDLLELFLREGDGQKDKRNWAGGELYTGKEVGNMCVYLKTNDKFNTFEKQEFHRVKLSNTLQEALISHPDYVIPIIPVLYVMHVNWKPTFFGKECQAEYGAPAMRHE